LQPGFRSTLEKRYFLTDVGLKTDPNAVFTCSFNNFLAVFGKQGLVGGYNVFTLVQDF
jgi:hypothetical protein